MKTKANIWWIYWPFKEYFLKLYQKLHKIAFCLEATETVKNIFNSILELNQICIQWSFILGKSYYNGNYDIFQMYFPCSLLCEEPQVANCFLIGYFVEKSDGFYTQSDFCVCRNGKKCSWQGQKIIHQNVGKNCFKGCISYFCNFVILP